VPVRGTRPVGVQRAQRLRRTPQIKRQDREPSPSVFEERTDCKVKLLYLAATTVGVTWLVLSYLAKMSGL
jgi:hypothetical protein